MHRRHSRFGLVALSAVALIGVAGCAPSPDYQVINRTEQVVVIAPGVEIAPCRTGRWSYEELQAAGKRLLVRSQAGDVSWIPDDATQLEGIPPLRDNQIVPLTIVITSTEPPRVVQGDVPDDLLPACVGDAKVD